MNPIVKADIKVDSKEFSDANDDQANYDGNRCIIICSSILLMLYKFNLTFIIYFMTIFSFLSNMHQHGVYQPGIPGIVREFHRTPGKPGKVREFPE